MRDIVHPAPTREPIDLRRYGGRWVAIFERRIVDDDRDLDALCRRLDRAGLGEKAGLMKVPLPGLVMG